MAELADTDQFYLQQIFPPELWSLIVLKIFAVKTYYKIIRASPYFENLLKPQLRKIIYTSGFQILLKQWNVKTSAQNLDCVLMCRKICTLWKSIVDAFLQNTAHHQLWFPTDSNIFYYIRNFSGIGCPVLQTINEIQAFKDHFHDSYFRTPGNPFLFRSVSVIIETETEILGSFIDLLSDYGHHIWFLKIHIRKDISGRNVPFVVWLQQIQKLLPNLIALKISSCSTLFFENDCDIRNSLENHPMPALKHLRILETSFVPTPVVESLLDTNSRTISQLSISSGINLAKLTNFPILNTLFLPFLNPHDYKIFENQAACLRIAKLHLNLNSYRYTALPVERAFRLLETAFSETLVELCLNLPCSAEKKIPSSLLLPKLRKMDLLLSDYESLDFLLPTSHTIKNLCVDVSNVRGDFFTEQRNKIKFYSYQGELQHSNIWTLFPNLLITRYAWSTRHSFGWGKLTNVVTRASLKNFSDK